MKGYRKKNKADAKGSTPAKNAQRTNLGKTNLTRLNLQLKRKQPFCKTAMLAFVWALLTNPWTMLSALQLADQPGRPLHRLVSALPYQTRATLLAVLLIGLPVIGLLMSLLALKQISSSWTPLGGIGYARFALVIAIASTLGALWIFIAGATQ